MLSAVSDANQRYITSLRSQAIGGEVLSREEVHTVEDLLRSDGGKAGVLVTGEAGIGKSGVMFQVVDSLANEGVPVIALRIDRLEPTQLPDNVGHQIGLPGSPARVLAAVAQGRHCVLVIDQLDAISLASGRNTSFYDCIYEILLQAQAFDNMRILLACRKFDLENDGRLRQLAGADGIAETVTVSPLSEGTVREVVTGLGINASLLNGRQLHLLSVPLHLKLLTDLAHDAEVRALNFESAQDLYSRYWQYKQQVLAGRLGQPVHWSRVINRLCDYMHERQTLSAPESIVDEWSSDASAMSSENVLVLDNHRFSFFHEGFFDYSYARGFSAGNESLLGLLTGDEQGLFRRTQVRQILLYLREADFDRYIPELKEVLGSDEIRFHIKEVVFALLADLAAPTDSEWKILASFDLEDLNNPASRRIWALIRRSTPWFRLVDSFGLIERWLDSSDENFVDQVGWLLVGVQQSLADRTAELLAPYVGRSERWNDRLRMLAQWTDWCDGRSYLDLMLRLIDEGVLDNAVGPIAVNSDFWSLLGSWAKSHSAWACEVIGHYLRRRRELGLQAGQPNPFDYTSGTIPYSEFSEEIISECARRTPKPFIEEVLPFVRVVVEDTAVLEDEGLEVDPAWTYRILPGGYSAESIVIESLAAALSNLALDEPDEFLRVIDPVRNSSSETLQYLVIQGFSANGAYFAEEAMNHLCENPERLNVGYLSDSRWSVRLLIEESTPHASPKALESLENALLDFYPSFERGPYGRRQFGYAQFTLLSGIAEPRLSQRGRIRREELQRKFPQVVPSPPAKMEVQFVESPIPQAAALRMKDEEWLSAISKYDREGVHTERNGGFLGGSVQLSRVLEEQVRQNPERFATLVARFPNDSDPGYFRAILRGLTNSNLDRETIERVCQQCHEVPGRPLGKEICDLIADAGHLDITPSLMDLVAWYATQHHDPDQELWRIPVPGTKDFHFRGRVLDHAINTVRGRAARTIAQLLREDPSKLTYFRPILEKMVCDPSIAVRSCVAEVLLVSLTSDRALTVNLFRKLCDTDDDLLQTHFVERFLYFALLDHYQVLSELLERMVRSDKPEVSTVGGRLACLTSLDLPVSTPLAEICVSGTDSQRLGAAEVMAANVRMATYRSFCEESLTSLFNDVSTEVRSAASRCFQRFQGSELGDYGSLIREFISSPAFRDDSFHLLRALDLTTADMPELVLSACENFIDVAGLAASDMRNSQAGRVRNVIQLTLRAYSQCSDDGTRSRCLDLVDRLMVQHALGIEEALDSYER